MKRVIALLAAVTMVLCGCQSEKASRPASSTEPKSETEGTREESTQAAVQESPVSAEDYYRYLNEMFLTDHPVVSDAPVGTSPDHNTVELDKAGGTGLASAMIEDFDGDGVLEMLTVELTEQAVMDTFWNRVSYEEGAPYDAENRCLRLLVRHYTYENEEITEYGIGSMNLFPDAHWGNMLIGIEKIEGEYYLFSKMTSENMATYGPSMYTICRVGGNGLNPMYTAPLDYSYADRTNYLDLMGLENTINPAELSLEDLEIPNYQSTPDQIRQKLGNRLLCLFNVTYPDDEFVHQTTDYTNLRQNLETNGANWEPIELPEGYRKELSAAPAGVRQIASLVETAVGCQFGEPDVKEELGIDTVNYYTEAGNNLALRWDSEAEVLLSVSVGAVNTKPDEEWYAIKDVLLSQVLNLSTEEQSIFLGNQVNWNDYVNGIQLGRYTIRVFAIQQAVFSAVSNY